MDSVMQKNSGFKINFSISNLRFKHLPDSLTVSETYRSKVLASDASLYDFPSSRDPDLDRRITNRTPERRSNLEMQTYLQEPISPLKGSNEEELVVLLKAQIELERNIEILRRDLALKSEFSLLDAFNFFDIDQGGAITSYHFEDAIIKMGVYPSFQELCLVMEKYDKDCKGYLL